MNTNKLAKKKYSKALIISIVAILLLSAVIFFFSFKFAYDWYNSAVIDNTSKYELMQTKSGIQYKIPPRSGKVSEINTGRGVETWVELPNSFELVISELENGSDKSIELVEPGHKHIQFDAFELYGEKEYFFVGTGGYSGDSFQYLYLSECQQRHCPSTIEMPDGNIVSIYIWKNLAREDSYECCSNPAGYINVNDRNLPMLKAVLSSIIFSS